MWYAQEQSLSQIRSAHCALLAVARGACACRMNRQPNRGEQPFWVRTDPGLIQFPCQALPCPPPRSSPWPPPASRSSLILAPIFPGAHQGGWHAAVPCTCTEIHCHCRVRTHNATRADILRHRLDRAGQGWAGQGRPLNGPAAPFPFSACGYRSCTHTHSLLVL